MLFIKMRKFFLIICVLFSLDSVGQNTAWVKSFGGVESEKGISIGVDSLGYVYCIVNHTYYMSTFSEYVNCFFHLYLSV